MKPNSLYRVFFLNGPSRFQYLKGKQLAPRFWNASFQRTRQLTCQEKEEKHIALHISYSLAPRKLIVCHLVMSWTFREQSCPPERNCIKIIQYLLNRKKLNNRQIAWDKLCKLLLQGTLQHWSLKIFTTPTPI